MAKTDPALIAGAATGELARGSLRLVDAIAISVSVIAPGMAMLLNVTGVVAGALILIVDVVTTAKGGSNGQALSAFSFSHSLKGGFNGVFYGIILGVTSYIGFETAADFGEETSNPRRNIPIAIIVATGFVVIFYLWTT